jgi:hypothetical protein
MLLLPVTPTGMAIALQSRIIILPTCCVLDALREIFKYVKFIVLDCIVRYRPALVADTCSSNPDEVYQHCKASQQLVV